MLLPAKQAKKLFLMSLKLSRTEATRVWNLVKATDLKLNNDTEHLKDGRNHEHFRGLGQQFSDQELSN